MTVTVGIESPAREQTRARYPDETGYVERDGVRVFWERYGDGEPTIMFIPPWSIVHSRCWKAQIPYFARHCRVLTFDPRGNGRSDQPVEPAAYDEREYAADMIAILDATGTDRAILVCLSLGAQRSLLVAAEHPGRVSGICFVGPAVPLAEALPTRVQHFERFDEERDEYDGWAKYNRHYWHRDFRGFVEFFFGQVFVEPHSTKQIEDAVGWGLETTPDSLVTSSSASGIGEAAPALCGRVRCPVLVIQGTEDRIVNAEAAARLARLTGGELELFEGSGHCPQARDPVRFNLAVREFALGGGRQPARRWVRGGSRRRRALYISSPIGLGHAQRDVAIADELRRLHPDLQIDWLAQHPVTAVLDARGERIHPASAHLANESGHIESESAEHNLHCFQAYRRMDEILVANFMVFHDLVREERYDLWIGDEAWELDYFLHENPELKSSSYVWLTDFVGWLPMDDGGEREAFLTADYNAEMIEQIARYPRLRDRSIFVGDPDDIVGARFGPELPQIRDWTEQNFSFAGYVTGFDPAQFADREALRAQLGYAPDEQVCIVTVGGSGVGGDLLARVIAAFPSAKRLIAELRMIVVAGPRIDPRSLPAHDGLEVRGYVHELYRHLAACDLAIVQGGLTTSMELTANGRPFLYFPLRHHFEQNFHVRHRLERYGAGRCMDFERDGPEEIAVALAEEIGRSVEYRPVARDGAARAAALIAELL
jgi:pimeloyl-ACP methyl ester carboxylesterase/predicted glycosyltransferase